MNRISLLTVSILVVATLAGCKIVKNRPAETAADSSGDDTRISALVDQTFGAKLVPHVEAKANDVAALRASVAGGLGSAGASFGHRGAGDGGAWSFGVKGTGKIVAIDRKSRAGKMELDTDADGKSDTIIQLGPVIKGTALRDIAPFYVFTDFRDQIEFAKLGRALNDLASASIRIPDGVLAGKNARFLGVVSLTAKTDPLFVVPLSLEVLP